MGLSNFVPGAGSGPHGNHGTGSADGHVIKMRVVVLDATTRDVRSVTPLGVYPDDLTLIRGAR